MILDVVFTLLMLLALIKGAKQGFILSLFHMAGLFIGLAVALKFSILVAPWLVKHTLLPALWIPFISFLALYLAFILLMHFTGKLFTFSSEAILMGWTNKLAGMLLYLFLYALTFSIFIFYLKRLSVFSEQQFAGSFIYPYVAPIAPFMMDTLGKLIPFFKDLFNQLEDFFSGVSHKLQ
jgi:membrane protein required for colicin V production